MPHLKRLPSLESQRKIYLLYIRGVALSMHQVAGTQGSQRPTGKDLRRSKIKGMTGITTPAKTFPIYFPSIEINIEAKFKRLQKNDDTTWVKYEQLPFKKDALNDKPS